MTDQFPLLHDPGLPPEDEMGFAVPVSPGHSLLLLNSYMRTDLLLSVHQHIHRLKDGRKPGSPLDYLAKSLAHVIATYDGINLFDCVGRNEHHIDPDFEFQADQDYVHDLKLMKHHRDCHRRTIRDLRRYD